MKPAVKYALMGGGSLVVLFGSFVTFAALSGQPMSKIAILKNFVKAPEEPKDSGSKGSETETAVTPPANPDVAKPAGKDEIKAVEKTASVLGAFALPSPFSTDELTDLQHELRTATQGAKARLSKIEQRERDLDNRERDLDQRQQELTDMRQKLLDKESELHAMQAEVTRDIDARNARESASWKELAKFFEDGDPADMAKKLLAYGPQEAARILHELDDERASSIVNALKDDKYREYSEAYRAQTVKDGPKKKP